MKRTKDAAPRTAAVAVAWGFRPACVPPTKDLIEKVLLAEDLQGAGLAGVAHSLKRSFT